MEPLFGHRVLAIVAEFLAQHALLLLGLGLLTTAVSVLAIVISVRAFARLLSVLRDALERWRPRARGLAIISRLITPTGPVKVAAYLVLHLGLGLAFTAAITFFVVVAEEVLTVGALTSFDVMFARALRSTATPRWESLFSLVSRFGSADVLTGASLVVAAALAYKRRAVLAVAWLAAQSGGAILIVALKEAFARARPEFASAAQMTSWSFPSGHAMGTFIFAGVACYLLIRHLRSWTGTTAVVIVSALWCLVMSFSRLYLGVHFASDVVAGLVAGVAWLCVCITGFEAVRIQGVRRVSVQLNRLSSAAVH